MIEGEQMSRYSKNRNKVIKNEKSDSKLNVTYIHKTNKTIYIYGFMVEINETIEWHQYFLAFR